VNCATDISLLEQGAVFDVRGNSTALGIVFELFGLRQTRQMNTVFESQRVKVLVIGPRNYLLQSTLDNEVEIDKTLKPIGGNPNLSCTNVSDMYQGIEVSGPQALEVLAQATSLNLHKFPLGSVTATEIFCLRGIVLHERLDKYHLYIDRSYAEYVFKRLLKCGDAVPNSI